MAVLYKTTGEIIILSPNNKKSFSYNELTACVGGMVEIVPLPSGKVMVVNEEGKLIGLPINDLATDEWKKEYPIDRYPLNNDQLVVGDALICSDTEIE